MDVVRERMQNARLTTRCVGRGSYLASPEGEVICEFQRPEKGMSLRNVERRLIDMVESSKNPVLSGRHTPLHILLFRAPSSGVISATPLLLLPHNV